MAFDINATYKGRYFVTTRLEAHVNYSGCKICNWKEDTFCEAGLAYKPGHDKILQEISDGTFNPDKK